MNISIIGTGYVGLVCGAGFAEMGNRVTCVDSDAAKIERLTNGEIPIYEPGLEEMVRRNVKAKNLSFSTSIKEALKSTNICFTAVGTPMDEDGRADLSHVLAVADEIGRCMDKALYVVTKSTVPVGTAAKVREIIKQRLAERGLDHELHVISNPEFLKEGAAVADFMKPDRIVVGVDSDAARELMRELYSPFIRNRDRLMFMDVISSEMTKYAANAMLATKISFINEIAGICELLGADVNKVREGIGSDSRIGYNFIYPGCGYGGSCFPKDVEALIHTASEAGRPPLILQAVKEVNARQKKVIVQKVTKRFGDDLSGLSFALWGLAFKPGTDDMREAAALTIVRGLAERGARVKAYDPKAMESARFYFKDLAAIEYVESKYDALKGADALILVTEWKEFSSPDFMEIKKLLKNPIVFDGRNQYDKIQMSHHGFEYYQIGVR